MGFEGIKKLGNWLWAIGDYCFEKNGKIKKTVYFYGKHV